MVLRARRRDRRAANVLPPEPVGRAVRWIWTPVIGIWIVMPWIVAFGLGTRASAVRPLWHFPMLRSIGAVLIVVAWLATRICWKRMGASWRMGIDPAEKTTLIATGPYAHARHPIYALSQLMMVCTVLVAPTPVMIVAASIHIALMQWEARREEAHLLKVHGQACHSYFAQVPRFIPRRNQ